MDLQRILMRPLEVADYARIWIFCLVAVAIAAGLVAKSALAMDDADLLKEARSLFQPLPKDMATAEFPVTPERVRLGRKLFFDPRISADGTESCAMPSTRTLRHRRTAQVGRRARPTSPSKRSHGAERRAFLQGTLGRPVRERRGAGERRVAGARFWQSRLPHRHGPGEGDSRLRRDVSGRLPRRGRPALGGQLGQGHRRVRADARLAVPV